MRQISLFDDQRLHLGGAVDLSLASLDAYGSNYPHWAVAFSGGKDSTATVTLVAWAIKSKMIRPPQSLTVLYADTRMELPPLYQSATRLLNQLCIDGFNTRIVTPEMDDRFFVYMLGRGVPPPKNRFRWCTPQLKIKPMTCALQSLRDHTGQKLLMLTGLRWGESAARDQRIALACSKDSGECGQGWYQVATPDAIADTLAPLLHWRLCHIYDWLYFDQYGHNYNVHGIADVYGESEVRTGCVGCNLTDRDTALERVIRRPEWAHLRPLLELRTIYRKLTKPHYRKRKAKPELRKDGQYSRNVQRLGPLTMVARSLGLVAIKDIQDRAGITLINSEEEARIRELWELNTWPHKWSGDEITGDVPISSLHIVDNEIVKQALLI